MQDVQVGDIILVVAGQQIPIDGRILEGETTIDQHTLTGESQPVEKEVGDLVLATTLVTMGRILVEVEKTGKYEVTLFRWAPYLDKAMGVKSAGLKIADVDETMDLKLPRIGVTNVLGVRIERG